VTRAAWIVVAVVFALRTVAAFLVPLTGDEAYYWEWSKRLAFGYVDHPPAVAWTIWLFGHLGPSPGLVRLGFIACGIVATLALGACTTILAGGDRRAGAVAALAFSLTPLASLAFGSASPDGPYLAFWCLALWLAARAARSGRMFDFALLGLALGERQLDVGVARAEARDRERHQRRPRGREGGHPQATPAQAGDRPERRLGGLQARKDALGVAHERLPRRGQGDPARMALQQRHPGFRLERGDLLGDRGLRVVERVRRGREGAAPGDLVEDLQTRDIKHK